MARRILPLAAVLAAPLLFAPPAMADDAGFLTRQLQDLLSDAGRDVRIRGFEGALSSTARIAEMTIADDEGVWLTLRDAELDWNRGALLRRQLSVTSLTAAEIILDRPPLPGPGAPPAPEATPFALPELPLSIEIGEIRADRVALGAPVLGRATELRLDGTARLIDGSGDTRLVAERIDGEAGRLSLEGSFSNVTRELALDLDLSEGPSGIAATLVGLPGEPPLRLRIDGAGPLSDFGADIALETEGEPRFAGRVELAEAAGVQSFRAELSGDVRPLFEPDYRGFFGAETRLQVAGAQDADGALTLEMLDLAANELTLAGSLALAPGGRPERVALTGRIGGHGGPVRLPLGGEPTTVEGVALDIRFDAALGPDWTADIRLDRLDRPDLGIAAVTLAGRGQLDTGPTGFAGTLDLAATGLAPADPGLAAALGPEIAGSARIDWAEGGPVEIETFELAGEDYGLSGTAGIAGQQVTLDLAARLAALARFSGLADRPLDGAAEARVAGEIALLDGAFDLDLAVTGQDLRLGIDEADALLAGEARIDGAVRRDTTGTTVRDLTVAARTLAARIDGVWRSRDSDLTATLDVSDLSVLGPDYAGRLAAEARLLGEGDVQRLTATATGRDLAAGIAEVDRLLAGESRIALEAVLADGVTFLETFRLGATTLAVDASGRIGRAGTELTGRLDFADLGVLGNGWGGRLGAEARLLEVRGRQQLRLAATGTDLALGIEQADALLAGGSRLTLDASREDGAVDIERFALITDRGLAAEGAGRIAPERSDFTGRAALSDLAVLGAGFAGRLAAEGSLTDVAGVQRIDATLTAEDLGVGVAQADRLLAGTTRARVEAALEDGGVTLERGSLATATGLEAEARGRIAPGTTRLSAEAVLESLSALDPGYGGRLALDLNLAEERAADTAEPRRVLTLTARGQDLAAGIFEVDSILRGASTLTVEASQLGDRLRVRAARLATPLLTATASATVEGTTRRLDIDARLADLAALVPGFGGPVTVQGNITDAPGNAYSVDLTGTGPGGIAARVAGRMARDLTAALSLSGTGNLALVNRFIDPINIQGPVSFDLRLDGALGLPALSGTVSTTGARLVAPRNALTLENIAATARLGASAVQIEAGATVQGGGSLAADGRIQLAPNFPADLSVTLDRARVTDRRIFETRVSGALAIGGPLIGGGRISGALSLDGAEMRIPSTGLGVGGYAPPGMIHIGESAAARQTRLRARVNAGDTARESRNPFALDILLSAPTRIFLRGRGLDAELGGELRITGTTDEIVPAGEFGLIRGRLDILGRRFVLSDGLARLTGRFVPFIRLTATTVTDGITAQIVLEGEADALEIGFSSMPELPEEEVVALILFGRGLDRLSPLQAAQLASAVATLAGRGGEGLIGGLRRSFGLDDLDVSTTEEGLAALRVGRYLTENIYTDLTVDSEGRSEVSINLDVTSSVTVRGRTDSEGRSGLGVFFERDY